MSEGEVFSKSRSPIMRDFSKEEEEENHDCVSFLSPQGDVTQTPHMAHCYTEKSYSFNASSSSLKSKTS